MIKVLQILLYVAVVGFAIIFFKDIFKAKKEDNLEEEKAWKPAIIGFSTNFFDTLGIGAFAPTVFLFKAFKSNIKDKQIPATLNVSCTLPVLCEAIIFIQATKVEPLTLVSLIAAAVVGSYLGAGVIARTDERKIQMIMGVALLISAVMLLLSTLNVLPIGGTALGLHGAKLIVAIVLFFVLGALMTAGIGLYAPAMVVVYSMGMDPSAAFPIMMGSCALLMPVASAKFVKEDAYAKKNSVIISLAGIVGVFIAAFFVKGLPIEKLKVLVIIVVAITSFMMLKAAFKNKPSNDEASAEIA
ncbi:MAG: sulfite exporter TauE/SafE family protein [Peptostreptococcus sp.]|uniref:sulfite exporter TauE/SafE family protein n=1 Tax=Peptostreptococcus sp. TaxID=1262 RepID=UPI002FCC1CD7